MMFLETLFLKDHDVMGNSRSVPVGGMSPALPLRVAEWPDSNTALVNLVWEINRGHKDHKASSLRLGTHAYDMYQWLGFGTTYEEEDIWGLLYQKHKRDDIRWKQSPECMDGDLTVYKKYGWGRRKHLIHAIGPVIEPIRYKASGTVFSDTRPRTWEQAVDILALAYRNILATFLAIPGGVPRLRLPPVLPYGEVFTGLQIGGSLRQGAVEFTTTPVHIAALNLQAIATGFEWLSCPDQESLTRAAVNADCETACSGHIASNRQVHLCISPTPEYRAYHRALEYIRSHVERYE